MDLSLVSEYCRSLPGVTTLEKRHPGNTYRFLVDKRGFAYYKTSAPQQGRFSLRTTPERYWELTDQENSPYPIQPARYMARFHWITIVDVSAIPDDWMHDWILGHAILAPFRVLSSVTAMSGAHMRLLCKPHTPHAPSIHPS